MILYKMYMKYAACRVNSMSPSNLVNMVIVGSGYSLVPIQYQANT